MLATLAQSRLKRRYWLGIYRPSQNSSHSWYRPLNFAIAVICAVSSMGIASSCIGQTQDNSRLYERHIQPLLKKHCVRCHGESKQEADLRLDHAGLQIAFDGVESELIGSDASESLLMHRLRNEDYA